MSALSSHSHRARMNGPVPAAAASTDTSPRGFHSRSGDAAKPSLRDCPACGGERQLARRTDGSGVGFRLFCPGCNSAKQKAYRATHPGFSTAKNRRWQSANPEKRSAHQAVCRALRSGRLTKGPCATCGTTHRVEAHHEDYRRPLEVTWFCRRHHLARHREIAAEATAALHQRLSAHTRRLCHV